MAENRDSETKTDLVDIENKLNEAFDQAYRNKDYQYQGGAGPLQSIGNIAKAIVEVRRQRHIEEGRGEMYNTRHNINIPQGRVVSKRGNGNGG
ncbi:MAG: hypothetical protein HND56_04730 [Pseudomonadota bacterium]|nr:hypothetical protein [Pseudomonadota bacterium]QKK05037.1 MAG: hypothetical protein HND56_04730 [Pseudomonadota bacterium]|tara:strand:+ start:1784 stop:2062 length:279 start_codon:yes stop_codon:yes gene_type:complete